ncbi:Transcriptional regulator [Bordetella sputigena]|uniref:HVO_A0114 family putative DNA-binding protein n=1 Tax=Bordetella sputigena TaxID=1416810 RepID=UPI0039F081D9
MERKLTITARRDWATALREAGARMKLGTYQGETLNFETPSAFFSCLTSNRWAMLAELQSAGTVGVRELARRLGHDIKRVRDDVTALAKLGLIAHSETGALSCPYALIHVDIERADLPSATRIHSAFSRADS